MSIHNRIVLFDGLCNLCNASVHFIIRNDPKSKFKFASLQSDFARKLLKDFPESDQDSVLYFEEGQLLERSSAALHIAKQLDGLWPVCYVFIIIPPFIRDGVYQWVAKNRYRWFGKRAECMVPNDELKARFVG